MIRVLVPSGVLGLEFSKDALQRGLENKPDIIAIDGGSTDSGPFYLGTANSKYSRAVTLGEWEYLLKARAQAKIPLVIGSSGTCGTDTSVDWMVAITNQALANLNQNIRLATIKSSQPNERVVAAFKSNRLTSLKHAPTINEQIITECTGIVALMGVEQFQAALSREVDVIIAGRATDTASIAALPLMKGIPPGIAWHGAKIAECGALCSTNPLSGCIQVDFHANCFEVEPLDPSAQCTPHSVSAHMLYENSDPFILHEPGGYLDVSNATYKAVSDRKVRVSGGQWVSASKYRVKVEGVRIAGYQTTSLILVRNQHYVRNIKSWVDKLKTFLEQSIYEKFGLNGESFLIEFRLIGADGVLGPLENYHLELIEIGVLGIVTAQTQQLANELAKHINPYLLHFPLTDNEELPTFAFPYSPAETERGPLYEFCLNHTLQIDDPLEVFTIEVFEANGMSKK